ncbi:MAG: metallophosphoesterase [Fuerstiella sp.]
MYDVIGDIHGHADELVELLTTLDYSEQHGCFRHASRKAVFCGDFIDRGPQIPDVFRIVRNMVEQDAALAVTGNHEFNALAWQTENPSVPGQHLRVHSDRNRKQHEQTLGQFDAGELQEALLWFGTLPVALDLQELRVVHACWDPVAIKYINSQIPGGSLFAPDFLQPATTPGDPLFDAVECVLKGPELPLPDGVTVTDKEGHVRHRVRIRWFDSAEQQTWKSYALPRKPDLPAEPVPADAPAVPYPSDAPPVFVGHYWLQGRRPAPLRANVACLDYSVARQGMLCAYRFNGESRLKAESFVTVLSRDLERLS